MEEKSVLLTKAYGHIHISLGELLEKRGITRNYLAKRVDTRFEVIDRWANGTVEKIDADILARICYVLQCRVEDIVEYVEV